MTETLTVLSARFAFDRHAGLPVELAIGSRDESRRTAFAADQQERAERDRKQQDKRRDEAEDRAWDFIDTVLATDAQIAEARQKLEDYDARVIAALQENDRQREEVRERLDRALDEAVQLPDGRRVFKSVDGVRVFDKHGAAVSADEMLADAIPDSGQRFEAYWADRTRFQELNEERAELHAFQERLDAARDKLDEEGLTAQELQELEQDIDAAMPARLRTSADEHAEHTRNSGREAETAVTLNDDLDSMSQWLPTPSGPGLGN